MDIKVATTRKDELIEDIAEMLSAFTTATGLSVDSIDIKRVHRVGPDYSPRYVVKAEVKL